MIYKNRLKQMRERKGDTLKDIANILEIDRTDCGHYENEDLIMPIKHLNKLCNYYEVSLDYIFGFTDIKNYEDCKDNIDLKLSGKRLKELRKENKLTQSKLGDILNCSYGTIAGYEIGRYIIATPFLYDICKKYNVSADYLLGKINYNPKN